MTKFIHSLEDREVTLDNGRTYYSRGYTVAYLEVEPTKVLVGMGVCGNNDSFCKKIGRLVAEGRMKHKPVILEKLPTESAYEVVKIYAEQEYWIVVDSEFELEEANAY